MVDPLTPADRSTLMAKVKSTGNRSTEMKAIAALDSADIGGWERHAHLPGKPDFYFPRDRLVVFIDGCFWHGCPQHVRYPQAHADYWREKIDRNRRRDNRVRRQLRADGFHVMRVWEHDLRSDTWVKRLLAMLRRIEAQTIASDDLPVCE
ncbi:MAG: DNA mismatch endonuclease Vsr [Thermomicrobiales bacterium]